MKNHTYTLDHLHCVLGVLIMVHKEPEVRLQDGQMLDQGQKSLKTR